MPYEKSFPSSPEAQSSSPIQENLRALAALFPSVVRDGQVDVDALRQLCGEAVVKEDELFGLNWRGKAEARRAALTPSLGTLRPCKEESKDWDTTQNLYIEGDNLEVLKLLRKSYGGKVKMIYIDPPYNTGKEFVYPDDYQNSIENYKKLTGQEGKYAANVETSGRYHTDWLNMMYPRLALARDLMCDDGVIFISIDEREFSNLKVLLLEIFGEGNYVGEIIWKNKFGSGAKTKGFIGVHEYILTVSKNGVVDLNRPLNKEEQENYNKNKDTKFPYRGGFVTQPLAVTTFDDRPSLVYPVFYKGQEIWPRKQWVWSKDRLYKAIENDEVVFNLQSDGSYNLRSKKYLIDENGNMRRGKPTTFFNEVYTQNGTNDIRGLFADSVIFDYTKPVDLIKYLLSFAVDEDIQKDGIILDFFSGSATTAHAVMKLNAEDGGHRRFIMVQLPEPCDEKSEAYKAGYKNICEIGKERIRRAGEKVKGEAGLAGQSLDIGFRVYKLDSSNVKAWNPQAEDLATAVNNYAEHLVGGRTEDDFLTEIMLKSGIDLVEEVEEREIAGHRVQSLGYGQYYACMAADLADDAEEVALGIAAWHEKNCTFAGGEQQDTCTVFVADRAFESNDAAKMNFVAILEQHGICNIKAL
ncbi:MAG: site-specific DNA-methyltransferase [Akkermansia sp.]|nr:site-specific DNA-methyltransferase [Akkermansia sp.]